MKLDLNAIPVDPPSPGHGLPYRCDVCDFVTRRWNEFVLHATRLHPSRYAIDPLTGRLGRARW